MTLPQGVQIVEDGPGKYLMAIPGVSGRTGLRVYRVSESTVKQNGWPITPGGSDGVRRSVGSIDESGFDPIQELAKYSNNLADIEIIRQRDEIAARHKYDTNYTDAERAILGDGSAPQTLTPDGRGLSLVTDTPSNGLQSNGLQMPQNGQGQGLQMQLY